MADKIVEYSYDPDTGRELIVRESGKIEFRKSEPRYFDERIYRWQCNFGSWLY